MMRYSTTLIKEGWVIIYMDDILIFPGFRKHRILVKGVTTPPGRGSILKPEKSSSRNHPSNTLA